MTNFPMAIPLTHLRLHYRQDCGFWSEVEHRLIFKDRLDMRPGPIPIQSLGPIIMNGTHVSVGMSYSPFF